MNKCELIDDVSNDYYGENFHLKSRTISEDSESFPCLDDFFRRSALAGICQPSPNKQGLFRDLVQTQLSLWTFTVSVVSTYFWQKRDKPRSLVVALLAVNVALCLSAALFVLVVAGHAFNGNGDLLSKISRDNDVSSSAEQQDNASQRLRTNSVCSYRSGRSSGYSTPVGYGKVGQPIFWQRKISTERGYYGNVLRR